MSDLAALPAAAIETWVLHSNDPSQPDRQWRAANCLQQWITELCQKQPNEFVGYPGSSHSVTTAVDTVLFPLLRSSSHEQVHFFCLTTLARIALSMQQRIALFNFLLETSDHDDLVISNRGGGLKLTDKPYLRNKASSLLAQCIVFMAETDSMDFRWMRLAETSPALFLKMLEILLEDCHHQNNNTGACADSQMQQDSGATLEDDTSSSQHSILPLVPATTSIRFSKPELLRLKQMFTGPPQKAAPNSVLYSPLAPFYQHETLLEQVFDCVLHVLIHALPSGATALNLAQNGERAQKRRHKDTIMLKALQTIKAFFLWTDASFVNTVAQRGAVLEALYIVWSSTTQRGSISASMSEDSDGNATLQQTTLEVWQEWILHSSSSSNTIDEQQRRSLEIYRLDVMAQVLECLHQSNVLPYHEEGESVVATIEVVIAVAELINAMGLEIIPVWENLIVNPRKNTNADEIGQKEMVARLQGLYPKILDFFFRAFAYDDIDVATAVLPMAARLTMAMEHEPETANGHGMKRVLPQLINILYQQMKYPEDFGYDYENEDDAEEEVFRSELCKLYNKFVRVAPDLCLQFVAEALAQVGLGPEHPTVSIAEAPTADVEATLRLLYHYCEGIRPPPGLKTVMSNETFRCLIVKLHESAVADHSHREVLCLYYEIVARYTPIFDRGKNAELLPRVLQAMSGPRGLQHVNPRVRSRCSYLLLRLVKSVASLLRPYVEVAVGGIQGLLSNSSLSLRPEDSLYLFETVGILLGKTGLNSSLEQQYLTQVMTPHVRSIENLLALPGLRGDAEHYGEILATSISAITYLGKGFHKPAEEVQLVLSETLHVALTVLEALPFVEVVRNKSMVLLQSMISSLGTLVLYKMPIAFSLLIEHCTNHDILFISQMFNQVCIKFKAQAIQAIDSALLPFLHKCRELTPTAAEVSDGSDIPPHLRTEQVAVQKLVFAVLHHIVMHHVTAVLTSPTNIGSFEMVLTTMTEGAVYVNDVSVKKSCIRFFRELSDQWSGSTSGSEGVFRASFYKYVCEIFVPSMMISMMKPSFDERDAMQSRNVGELAHVIYLLVCKVGMKEGVLSGLQNLPASGVPAHPNLLQVFHSSSKVEDFEAILREWLHDGKSGTKLT